MADPKRQAAFEELMRRGVIQTPEQRAAVAELSRRGLLRTTPYASFTSPKTPTAATTKPVQTAKPKAAAGKTADTSYRGTGASMRGAPPTEMSFLDRAVAVLNIPRAALLAMPNALDALRRSQEGRDLLARDPEGQKVEAQLLKMSYPERVKYFAEGGATDPAQTRARAEATAKLGKVGRAGSVAMEFGAQAVTDPLTWATGGGSAVAKAVPKTLLKGVPRRAAQAANVGAAGALTAQQLATGVPQVIEGVKRGSVEQTTAGVLATAFGTLAAIGTVHGLRQWQADTGVSLTPQQEKVILQARPKNRPNIARRFAKIQEARAKDVPTRMPPVTPTPAEAAPVPAKTAKARKTRRPAKSEPIPAVGDNQPLGNEAVAPQPAPVGSGGRGDVALPAEPVPTPQAEAVSPVQRGLEAGAEAAPEAALAAPEGNPLHTIRLTDFLAEAGEKGLDLTDAMRMHKAAVQQALDAGLPVDKEVLKPYPGLKKGGVANAVPVEETAGGLLRQAEAGAGAGVELPGVGGENRPGETAGEGQAQAGQAKIQYLTRAGIVDSLSIAVQKKVSETHVFAPDQDGYLIRLKKIETTRGIREPIWEATSNENELIGRFRTYQKAVQRVKELLQSRYRYIPRTEPVPLSSRNLSNAVALYEARKQEYAPDTLPIHEAAKLVAKIATELNVPIPAQVLADHPDLVLSSQTAKLPGVGGENRPGETAGEGQAAPAQVLPQADPNLDFVGAFRSAGQNIANNMYRAWRESLQKTGKLPPQEARSLPGQVWQRLMDAGFPPSEATFNRFEEQARAGAFTTPEKAQAALLEWQKPVETPPLQAPTERLPEGPTVKLPKSPETPTAKLPDAPKLSEKVRAGLDEIEAAAKKRLGGGLSARIDAGLFDYAIIGAVKLAKKGLDFAEWSAEMVAEHGEKIKPHLQEIWDAAHEYYNNALRKRFAELPELTPPKAAAPQKAAAPTGNAAQPSLRHRDMQAIAEELGVTLAPKVKESWQQVTDRALKEYDSILDSLKRYDPDTHEAPTREERIVAGARIREIQRELNPLLQKTGELTKEDTAKVTALEMEAGQLLNLAYRAGSEAGRNLNLQKILLPDDPTDPAAVLLRAQRLAGSPLGIPARRTLTRLAEEAKAATAAAETRIARRKKGEATAQPNKAASRPNYGAKNTIVTREAAETIRQRLRQKLNRASAGMDPTILSDLAQLGIFHLEAGTRQFADWSQQMLTEYSGLSEADLQRVWIHVKANKALPQGQRSVPKPQTFVEELARRVGNENARAIVDTLEEKQPGLLEKLIQGEALTESEQTLVGQTYLSHTRQRAATAPLTRSQAMQSVQAAANAMRPKTPRKPRQSTAAEVRNRADKLLDRLGTTKPRQPNPLLDEATLEYAKGAKDLHRFAVALRKKHEGTTFTEAELNKLFREAAEQYHKDFRQVEAIKRQMTEVVAKEVYRQKPWYGKIWHGAKELNNFSRSLILGPDISFLFRQGGPLVANRFLRMNKAALPEMWRALQREEVARAIDASIRHGKNGDLYEKAGLDFSDIEPGTKPGQEEGIASDWLEKVPGIRRPYRAADRANTVLINKIRAETFDLLYDPQKHNIEQAKAIARYINVATGRGDLSNAAIAGLVRGTADVFLSPRYMVSRFQYLMGLPLWKAPKGARKLIAKEYATYYLRIGAFLTLASQIPGVDVEADPRSSDFGTIRIGNLNIDILSGLKQPITAGARIATGQNYLSDEGKAIPSDPFRTFLNFFLYKMSPLPQLGADVALRAGKDFKGDPLTVGGVSRRLFLNITAQDIVETLLEKGIDPQTALELGSSALASQVGVGANLRDRAEEAQKRAQARQEAAQEKDRVDRILQR